MRFPDLAEFYMRNVPQQVQEEDTLTRMGSAVRLNIMRTYADHMPVNLAVVFGLVKSQLHAPTLQF